MLRPQPCDCSVSTIALELPDHSLSRERWQRESWGSTIPLVPSSTHVSKTAGPWPGEHNKNVASEDSRSLTDNAQINMCTKKKKKIQRVITAVQDCNHKKYAQNSTNSTASRKLGEDSNVLPATNAQAKQLWQSMQLR